MKVKKIATVIVVLLWFVSVFFAVVWIFGITFPYEPEPLTYILGLMSIAITGLVKRYSNALETEKYSVANVLAKGYVNNFLEPVLTQLIKNNSRNKKPSFYIFIPNLLTELAPKSIDRLKGKLKDKGLLEKTVKVKLSEGRGVRDVMTISNANDNNVYFDFPNTLYALTDFVEFKMNSPKDSLNLELKNKIGEKYITRFKEQLIESLREKQLYPEYVKFTNGDFELDF